MVEEAEVATQTKTSPLRIAGRVVLVVARSPSPSSLATVFNDLDPEQIGESLRSLDD